MHRTCAARITDNQADGVERIRLFSVQLRRNESRFTIVFQLSLDQLLSCKAPAMADLDDEPLNEHDLDALTNGILDNGSVHFTDHVRDDKFPAEDLDELDCRNVLRNGWLDFSEYDEGSWTYRIRTSAIVVVGTLLSDTDFLVITAWRDR